MYHKHDRFETFEIKLQTNDVEFLKIYYRKPGREKSKVLSSRANIFDGDEFDIFTHDSIDTSLVHIGKKYALFLNYPFVIIINDFYM